MFKYSVCFPCLMESSLRHTQDAVKNVQMASYLLSTTYPLVKEPKTLLLVANHTLSSFMSSISALLSFERSQKTIPPYHDTTESKLNCFKQNCVKKYKLEEYLTVIERIIGLSEKNKKAAISFSRDNKYVICADQFSTIETISEADVKLYIKKAKEFALKVQTMLPHE
jgi:hypothetical protein